jgi:hypothetical protein
LKQKNQSKLIIYPLVFGIVLAGIFWMVSTVPPSTGQEALPTSVNYFPVVAKFPTPTLTPTPTPTPVTPVPGAPNLLPNPSFEDGWYHLRDDDGKLIPELQVPNQWTLVWDEGENPLDPAPWNEFVRPESRLLSEDFLPPDEHDLFIWDGNWTLKIFKGYGALSYRLTTNVKLPAGKYLFQINVFPDLVVGYDGGEKIWAPDPYSGEVRFLKNGPRGEWILPTIGEKDTLQYVFEVNRRSTINLGVAIRGRWAIQNNGWFMDDWSLTAMQN